MTSGVISGRKLSYITRQLIILIKNLSAHIHIHHYIIINLSMFNKIFSLLFVLNLVLSFNLQSNQCQNPLLSQFYLNYAVPIDDVNYLITQNYSTIKFNDISNKSVTLTTIVGKFTYGPNNRSINYEDAVKVSIENDTFNISFTYLAEVSATIVKRTHNVSALITNIPINYKKQYSLPTNTFTVNSATVKVESGSLSITFPSNTSSSDKDKIKAVTESDLVKQLKTFLSNIQDQMNDNAKKQTLSETFTVNPYMYRFYNFTIPFNVQSMKVAEGANMTLVNELKGTIEGMSDQMCPQGVQDPQQSYHTFVTQEIMANVAQYTLQNYENYQNININSSWIRSRIFQFKVIDLEYAIEGLLDKYSQYYMNPIYFTCAFKNITSISTSAVNKVVNLIAQWNCEGFIYRSTQENIKILDIDTQIQHSLKIFVSSSSLSIYSDLLNTVSLISNPVDDLSITNLQLAKIYMSEMFNDCRTYVPGTYFKVKKGSSKIKLVQSDAGNGFWIG